LLPHLQPPSATAYEADQLALTAQFDEIAKLVTSIESDTSSQRTLLDEQREKVDGALDKLQIAIRETKDAEARTKADLREIREEVNNVRDMLPKVRLCETTALAHINRLLIIPV
jgi:peroxin-14